MNRYTNFDILDSLDFLIPPVKKNHYIVEKNPLEAHRHTYNPALQINKQKRKRESRRSIVGSQTYPTVEPRTSIYLKEPSKQFIQEDYTICDVVERKLLRAKSSAAFTRSANCRNINTEVKPIIKITVIPKTVETQTSKVLNKRIYKRKITNSVSSHDNCLRSKNIYISSRTRRKRVKEIKTSESENFSFKSPTKSIIPLQHCEEFFDSLAMDKRNVQNRRNTDGKLFANQGDQRPARVKTFPGIHGHTKQPKLNLNSPKSRVRIVGRLGLTEDDRYVLNCAATLNDKPIPTNVTSYNEEITMNNNKDRTYPHDSNKFYDQNYSVWNSSIQKDVNRFSNIQNNNVGNKKDGFHRTESQGIQVNLCLSKSAHRTKPMKDKYVQCMCQNKDTRASDDEENAKEKREQNPIVVISVYPKSGMDGVSPGHTIRIEEKGKSPQKYSNQDYQIGSAQNFSEPPTRENYRSRSPSPAKPQHSIKIHQNVSNDHGAKRSNSNRVRDPSPSKSPIRSQQFSGKNNSEKNVSKFNRLKPPKQSYSVENRREIDDLAASRNLAKKALVDSYIKNFNTENVARSSKRKSFLVPKDDASKVTINIEGETEQYDLLFEQDRLNTHLAVRKTVKDNGHKKKAAGKCNDSPSMENLLNLSQEATEEFDVPKSMSPSKMSSPYKDNKDDTKLNKRSSQIHVRDSIEISHRRSSLSSSPKTSSSKRSNNGTSHSSQSTKAQVKHYRGDECGIPDPNERDKEIRELLGILTGRKPKENKECNQLIEDVFPVYKQCEGACCEDERNSEKNLMTGISITKLPAGKRVENFFKKIKKTKTGKPTDITKTEMPAENKCPKSDETINKNDLKTESFKECNCVPKELQNDIINKANVIPNQWSAIKPPMCPHCREPKIRPCKEPTDAGNLVLARNIQVFLEVEQFNKQKPIMLSRKQYEKVKKTIQSTISKNKSNEKQRLCYYNNYSMISVGDVKMKSKLRKSLYVNREVQTDCFEVKKDNLSEFLSSLESFERHEASCRSYTSIFQDSEMGTPQFSDTSLILKENFYNTQNNSDKEIPKPRIARSSVEVRYASVAFLKHVAYSSPLYKKMECSINSSSANNNNSTSLHTIFKGFKKSVTPNLGTSAFSLCSESDSRLTYKSKQSQCGREQKCKKPLLQRLVSCLIMRSTRVSEIKIGRTPPRGPLTNTSTDSYHFSTSFAGFELPSSMYDTSASFYSNHTVLPISKMKRGFLSSVRGFLTNRRN